MEISGSKLLSPLARSAGNCEFIDISPSLFIDFQILRRLFGWLADIVGRKRMYGIELMISEYSQPTKLTINH